MLFSDKKIVKKMKRISERLDEILDERTKFHLTELREGVVSLSGSKSPHSSLNHKSTDEKKILIKL